MILTFAGEGNGITEENFAAKLIGKTVNGKLLFAYARLPWLDYLQAALSARLPKLVISHNSCSAEVEIQNFGQTTSEKSEVMIEYKTRRERMLGVAQVPPLKPFEKTRVKIEGMCDVVNNELLDVTVTIKHSNQKPITLSGKVSVTTNK